MTIRRSTPWAAAALAFLAAACTQDLPSRSGSPPLPSLVRFDCVAAVRTGEVTCTRPDRPGGPRFTLTLATQGVDVWMRNDNVSYDPGTQIFRADVRVQNLLAQAIGTPNGSTSSGIRVFYAQAPHVTSGAPGDTVTVANADSVGTFTAANQEYYLYSQILPPRGMSVAREWRWNVPSTVAAFAFSVGVSAEAHYEAGVLHWRRDRGQSSPETHNGIWGTADNHVMAVGDNGSILNWDGNSWSRMPSPVTDKLYGVWGLAPDTAFAVGGSSASFPTVILKYVAGTWSTVSHSLSAGPVGRDVWGTSTASYFVAASRSTVFRYSGGTWTTTQVPGGSNIIPLNGIWGSAANDVYAVGNSGLVSHWDGSSWTQVSLGTSRNLNDVWGSSASDVYVVGDAGYVAHFDGTSWSTVTTPTDSTRLVSVSGSAPDTVLIVQANNKAFRRQGGSWGSLETVAGASFGGSAGWMSEQGNPYVAGIAGQFAADTAGTWVSTAGAREGTFFAAWMADDTAAFAAGDSGKIYRMSGGAWSSMGKFGGTKRALWGTSKTNVYAVGSGGVWRYDGSSWTQESISTAVLPSATVLYGVWGSSASDVYAVGSGGVVIRWDGSAWQSVSTGVSAAVYAVWGSSATDVYVAAGTNQIRHFDGTSWNTETVPGTPSGNLTALGGSGASDVYMASGGGVLYQRNSSTGAWSSLGTVPGGSNIQAMSVTPGGDVYVAGMGGLIAARVGTTWRALQSGVQGDLYTIHVRSASRGVAGGDYGALLRGTP